MREGTCIHFRLISGAHSKCAKGLNYVDEFKVTGKPVLVTAPCVTLAERFQFQGSGEKRKLVAVLVPVNRMGELEKSCAWREFPTREQLERADGMRGCTPAKRIDSTPARQWWLDNDK